MRGRLLLGTKRYSSWSLRGWLAVRLAGIEVDEVVIPLAGGRTEAVDWMTPSGTVPVLEHGGVRIADSLAIAEYCAELAPPLWPADRPARAHARAISAEMHGGFRALRAAMPMNLGRHDRPREGGVPPEAARDIARIAAIWRETRMRYGRGGPFLFGAPFTLADAMYAPVVTRFASYGAALDRESRRYCDAVRAQPLVARWVAEAASEPPAFRIEAMERLD